MLTTLLLALTLATGLPADVAKADRNVEIAARAQAECFDPAECRVADELMAAARAEQVAATALATSHHGPSDPWQSDYSEPFASVDTVPEYLEAQAAFELAVTQNTFDELGRP